MRRVKRSIAQENRRKMTSSIVEQNEESRHDIGALQTWKSTESLGFPAPTIIRGTKGGSFDQFTSISSVAVSLNLVDTFTGHEWSTPGAP